MPIGALLGPILQSAATGAIGALGQKSQTKAANSLLNQFMAAEAKRQEALRAEYGKAQEPLTKNILSYIDVNPLEVLKPLLGRNQKIGAAILPEISAALGRFAGDYERQALSSAGKGKDFSLKTILDGAAKIGIDPAQISSQMLGMIGGENAAALGLRDILKGRAAADRSYGQSLRDGSFYKSGVGQQAAQNIFAAMAPMSSSRGLDALTGVAYGGGGDIGENRGITAFLRNAESNRMYGDRVLSGSDQLETQALMQPFAVRDQLTGRLGGLLSTGVSFGGNVNQAALGFGGQTASTGAQMGGAYGSSQLNANLLSAPEMLGYRSDQAQGALGMSDLYASLLKFSLSNSPYNPALQMGQQTLGRQQGGFGMS